MKVRQLSNEYGPKLIWAFAGITLGALACAYFSEGATERFTLVNAIGSIATAIGVIFAIWQGREAREDANRIAKM